MDYSLNKSDAALIAFAPNAETNDAITWIFNQGAVQ